MHPISPFPQEQKNDYELNFDIHNIKKAEIILRAFNHKLRQDLISMIHDHKSIMVTQLYTQLRIEQSVASQHLAILRKAGIVTILRQGKHKYYSINPVRIDEIKNFAKSLVG
jgi:DNA-binding transcriptional ArsR family regulator